jgi:outer membrane beta-barrel protein
MTTSLSRLIPVGAVLAALLTAPFAAHAEEDPLANDFDLYWGEKRDVTNIHKRKFMKDGRHEFAIMGGVIPNDDFFTYYPLSLRYDYSFSEDIALEVSGSYMFKKNSDLENFLENDIIAGLQVQLPQYLQWQAGAGVLWTPIYGKFGAFATKVAHFDFGIVLGVMALGTMVQPEGKPDYESRIDVGGNAGATLRFYVLDFMAIRLDYRHYFYAARDADDNTRGVSYPAEISLGLSFWTPEPK